VRPACIIAYYARACVSLCSVYLSANQPRSALGRGVLDVDRKRTTHSCSRSDAALVPSTQAAVGANAQPYYAAGGGVLIGLLAPLAALGLLVIILVAIATSGRQRIKLYKPIDEADRIDDWLYLPETLYVFMLIIIVSAGAGPYSLNALILGLMNKHFA